MTAHDSILRRVPNALTLLRLVLAAAFFAALNAYRFPDTNPTWALIAVIIFIIAGFTDFLDGHLARRWEATTTFGRIMDPFCDKVLILGAFIYLAGPRFIEPEWVEQGSFFTMATGVYPWMVVVLFAREMLVTTIRGLVEAEGIPFAAQGPGKMKMLFQSLTIPLVILLTVYGHPDTNPAVMWTMHAFVYGTVIITIGSGIPYVIGLGAVLKKDRTPGSQTPGKEGDR